MKELKYHEKEWLDSLEKLIYSNLDNPNLTIAELARGLYLSPASLNRKVNQICDCSPADYIRKMRLEKAKELLEANDKLSLIKVAKKVGYSNPTYFSKIYYQFY